MAFASGAVTFRRYRVLNCEHKSVDDAFIEALSNNAFSRYSTMADDDLEIGWITQQHLFDTGFAGEKVAVGRFAQFSMRVDRNSVPGSILRSYIQIEEAAALDASGKDFLSKSDKRQAKEAAVSKADKEARSGAFRRIAAYPVLWDLDNGILYFGNGSSGANEKMQRLFIDTFDVLLEPMTTHYLGARISEQKKKHRGFEDAAPAHLITPPGGAESDGFEADPEDRGFLGREFLSWLWYRADKSEGLFSLGGQNEVGISIVKQIHLKCDFGLTGSSTIKEDAPTLLPESKAALGAGKQPAKLGLLFGGTTGEWAFMLDAVQFGVSGLTLPDSDQKDKTARLEERFEAIAELGTVLDNLFGQFLDLRLSADWSKHSQAMMKWVADSNAAMEPKHPRLASTA